MRNPKPPPNSKWWRIEVTLVTLVSAASAVAVVADWL